MKKLIILLLALVLFLPAAQAEGLPLVVDGAGILTEGACADLAFAAQRVSAEHGMDVVLLTVDTLGGKSAQDYAADYYDETGYGQGDDHSGVLFLVAMQEGEWYMLTTGEGIRTFTDYGIYAIADHVVPYLAQGDYAMGLMQFIWDAELFIQQAESGEPYDTDNEVTLGAVLGLTGGDLA
jgi:uncharacterized protein